VALQISDCCTVVECHAVVWRVHQDVLITGRTSFLPDRARGSHMGFALAQKEKITKINVFGL
jgi:hypothetical protein